MKKLIKGSLASEIETARKVNEIVEWINEHEKEDTPEEPKSLNEIDVVLEAIEEYCNEHSFYSGDLEKIKVLNIVEDKLRALKRLKDKGMIKYSFHKEKSGIDLDYYTLTILAPRDEDSLNLVFGGEQ